MENYPLSPHMLCKLNSHILSMAPISHKLIRIETDTNHNSIEDCSFYPNPFFNQKNQFIKQNQIIV